MVDVSLFFSDETLAAAFPTASWGDVQSTELLRRFDRKFVLQPAQLKTVLGAVTGRYRLLPSGSHVWATYDTTYFDTPDLFMFTQHARGKRPRLKVRIRHYRERSVSFLEVKEKTNRGETRKKRLELPFKQNEIIESNHAFIRKHCDLDPMQLRPLLTTQFKRLTLLDPIGGERVTSDMFLSFSAGGFTRDLAGVVVTEVKQAEALGRSPVVDALRAAAVRPRSFSKYSVGVALLGLSPRLNALRPALRMIERLLHA